MKYVYVAGSIDSDNIVKSLDNIRKGIEKSVELMRFGLVPFCPFLDFQFFLSRYGNTITKEQIQSYSLAWVEKCDAIFVLPDSENSGGTQREIKRAKALDIPVFYRKEDLLTEAGILHKTW